MPAPRNTRSRGRECELLIERLVADATPVHPPLAAGAVFGVWAVLGVGLVAALVLALGPLRPDVSAQLGSAPRFALECGVGLAAAGAALWGALRLAVPGASRRGRTVALSLLPLLAWAALLVYGLRDPALAPSMAGKRAGCTFQALLAALPPLGLALWLLRRHVVLECRWAAALLGVAAAALPAGAMQLACLYEPRHALLHHLSIVPVLALGAGLLGARLLRSL